MSYVKISDPAIIDLSAWHQIIQVVNQHSDSLSALSNNFGASMAVTVPTDGDNWRSVFDLGTQILQFGKTKTTGQPTQSSDSSADVKLFANGGSTPVLTYRPFILKEGAISFAASFSQKPIVVATLSTNLVSRTEFKVTVGDITEEDFSITVSGFDKPTGNDLNRTVYVNWVAVGPK